MDFPARVVASVKAPQLLIEALGVKPVEVLSDASNYTAVFEDATAVRELVPDLSAIALLDRSGVVVTAHGDEGFDFVSRYFAPGKGIPEDPVTGGAHCALAPYWSRRLGKTELLAYQASRRGGEMICRVMGDRVELEGNCVFFFEGYAEI
jgi:predicted PhzF superfamily epimerase YddE/YHI9